MLSVIRILLADDNPAVNAPVVSEPPLDAVPAAEEEVLPVKQP